MMKLCLYRIPVCRGNNYFETNIEEIIKEIVSEKHADCELRSMCCKSYFRLTEQNFLLRETLQTTMWPSCVTRNERFAHVMSGSLRRTP